MSKRAGAPPTIIDVAKKAGVSIKTVSRVLNKEATVHPDTRALVLEVVAELNYRPQLSARSLAGARSFLIGLLYFEPSASYVAGVQRGATQRCRDADRHLVVESLSEGADLQSRIEHMLAALRPDGMILAPPICDDPTVLATLRASMTPCVLISPTGEDGHGMARVLMDDVKAAEELTNLLIGLGHADIAFIQGHQSASARRQRGFERAMAAHGLPVDPALVVTGRFNFDSGFEAANSLLARARRPSAIFAANDDMALGALAAAQRLGIAVPGEVSIVGFDDSQAASLVWPAITTVRQPVAEMAMAAVDMLLSGELKAGSGVEPPLRVLPHELVVRGSTAAPQKAARAARGHAGTPA